MQRHEGHINFVKDTKIVAGMFGGVGNFAYNQHKVRAIEERRAAASRYGFSCDYAREAANFFIPAKLNPFNHSTI